MAHYIAELVQDVEKATNEERPAKMHACSEAILNLWKHRYELPDGMSPFAELEPILRALETLDPDIETPRYLPSVRSAAEQADEKDETKSWLELVDGLDYTAKTLIRYCLTQAAQTSLNKSAKWIELAEAGGADVSLERPAIRVLHDEHSFLRSFDRDDVEKKRLEDRLQRLTGFAELAMALVSDPQNQLQEPRGAKDS